MRLRLITKCGMHGCENVFVMSSKTQCAGCTSKFQVIVMAQTDGLVYILVLYQTSRIKEGYLPVSISTSGEQNHSSYD